MLWSSPQLSSTIWLSVVNRSEVAPERDKAAALRAEISGQTGWHNFAPAIGHGWTKRMLSLAYNGSSCVTPTSRRRIEHSFACSWAYAQLSVYGVSPTGDRKRKSCASSVWDSSPTRRARLRRVFILGWHIGLLITERLSKLRITLLFGKTFGAFTDLLQHPFKLLQFFWREVLECTFDECPVPAGRNHEALCLIGDVRKRRILDV